MSLGSELRITTRYTSFKRAVDTKISTPRLLNTFEPASIMLHIKSAVK